MGASSSSSLLEEQLVSLLKKQGTIIKSKTAKEFLEVICTASPWFVTSGGLNVPDWEQVKTDLQKYLHKEGPDSIPIATFSLWRLVKDALLSDNMKVKEQVAEAEAVFGEVQNEEVTQSLQTSDASELESEEEDEESKLEEEIRVLKRKLKKISCRDRPPARNPDYCSREILPSPPLGEFKGGVAYPVIETLNAEGQAQRQHEPLEFKAIKQLKEAVISYGPLAPFTLAIYESFSSLFLTPSDWQQLCRATLSGGDYLIWRSEFHEHCQATAARNAAAGFPQRNLDMLTGAGQYNTLAAQITYDPAVYAQIATAAVRAWKNLPNKGAGDQLSKVMQGPSEPFSEFVDRLLQLTEKLFGDANQAMPSVKQLAFENANKYCKEAIRPHKNKSLNEYLVQMHAKYHLNAESLRFHTGITKEQATQVVKSCSTCVEFLPVPHLGVNPRGLLPNHIWQMDVTHIPSFGKLQFVHVCVDTYSSMIFASARSGQKVKDVKAHCLQAFAYMGVPKCIKTDNGPAYCSRGFQQFCQDFNIEHKTGIPYNPQGQAIVERCHRTLKTYLDKIKRGELAPHLSTPHSALSCILYTLNFLTMDSCGDSAADKHWKPSLSKLPLVKWKELSSGMWKGPDPVLVWARGSVCVFPQDHEAPFWIPERCVRPVSEHDRRSLGLREECSHFDAGRGEQPGIASDSKHQRKSRDCSHET